MAYVLLTVAIVSEVIATSALKASNGLTRPWPVVVVVVGYGLAFWLLAYSLKTLPVGFVYAIWAGLGVVGVALVGNFVFGETFNAIKIAGIALVVAGVALVNLGST